MLYFYVLLKKLNTETERVLIKINDLLYTFMFIILKL